MGLGDTYCTDDELDALATCAAGYIPDYADTCSCLPDGTDTTTVCSGSQVSIGGVCVAATGSVAQAAAAESPTLSSLTSSLPTWWPWALAGAAGLYFMTKGKG